MNLTLLVKRIARMTTLCLCLAVLFSGCSNKQDTASHPGFVQAVNPLVIVDSIQEMEQYLGYDIPILEKDVDSHIVLVIDGSAESGRIRYTDGSIFNIKRGTGDISGIYGGTREAEEVIHGVSVSFYQFEDIHYAIWEASGFTYSLTGGTTLRDDVAALI